jgi:hypothetical protein
VRVGASAVIEKMRYPLMLTHHVIHTGGENREKAATLSYRSFVVACDVVLVYQGRLPIRICLGLKLESTTGEGFDVKVRVGTL